MWAVAIVMYLLTVGRVATIAASPTELIAAVLGGFVIAPLYASVCKLLYIVLIGGARRIISQLIGLANATK